MKLANGILGMALAVSSNGLGAWAQAAPGAAKPSTDVAPTKAACDTTPCKPKPDLPVQTFYINNASQPNDGNEFQTAIRNLLPPDIKIDWVPTRNILIVRATPDELMLTQKLLNDLDRPKKSYRLTYTIAEIDGGKHVDTQHFAMMVADGQRATLKQGSRVPIVTGGTGKDGPLLNQFQYIDVGMSFDSTVNSVAGGAVLKTKVEQSSMAEDKSGGVGQDPVIRQTTLEGTSMLTLGKPLMLGSVDVPGSTRHLDVEVTIEEVK